RNHFPQEIVMQPGALFPRPVLLREEAHALVGEVRKNLLVEQPVLLRDQRVGALADHGENLRRGRLPGNRYLVAEPDALFQFGDADLEELVQVARQDAQEPQPLQRRNPPVLGLGEHPLVECQDGELARQELGLDFARRKPGALEALARFGERLRGFPRSAVRAVGTSALRVAKNADSFLSEAEATLGFPIEVIFGREEARLIYLGVAHSLAPSPERRLVIDIGGGSTELIIGTGLEPELMESTPMGCVSYSLRFFPEGRLEKSCFKRAELAAANELQRIVDAYRRTGWRHAVASSGTAKSLAAILRESDLCEQGISAAALDKLRA